TTSQAGCAAEGCLAVYASRPARAPSAREKLAMLTTKTRLMLMLLHRVVLVSANVRAGGEFLQALQVSAMGTTTPPARYGARPAQHFARMRQARRKAAPASGESTGTRPLLLEAT